MTLRPYLPSDWDRICAIHDAARVDELAASGLLAAYLTLAQTAANEGLLDGEVVVCEDNGKVEGFVAFHDHELTWLYAAPLAGKRGIGRALLRRAVAASDGAVTTEVLVGNERALELYLSEGFKVVGRIDGKLTGNESFAASGYVLDRAHLADGQAAC